MLHLSALLAASVASIWSIEAFLCVCLPVLCVSEYVRPKTWKSWPAQYFVRASVSFCAARVQAACLSVTPSVSKEELVHYERMKAQFSSSGIGGAGRGGAWSPGGGGRARKFFFVFFLPLVHLWLIYSFCCFVCFVFVFLALPGYADI